MSDEEKLDKLIVILGPTASGKSGLSLKLAASFKGEIISADSMQVYQGFDIGTAKVTPEEHKLFPHHLLNVCAPNSGISVAEYKDLAIKKINSVLERGRTPFMVGGTGFYISSIVDNLEIPRVAPNTNLRAKLQAKCDELGVDILYQELIKQDPEAAEFVEPHNSRRIIRALEVIESTGKKLSDLRTKGPQLYDILQIGLEISTKLLESNINQRVNQMFDQGLVKEVEGIMTKYGRVKPLDAIGYKEVVDYLDKSRTLFTGNGESGKDIKKKVRGKKISQDEAKNLIKLHTRQYAKRQMKWFKRDKTINWVSNYKEAKKLVDDFL